MFNNKSFLAILTNKYPFTERDHEIIVKSIYGQNPKEIFNDNTWKLHSEDKREHYSGKSMAEVKYTLKALIKDFVERQLINERTNERAFPLKDCLVLPPIFKRYVYPQFDLTPTTIANLRQMRAEVAIEDGYQAIDLKLVRRAVSRKDLTTYGASGNKPYQNLHVFPFVRYQI